MYPFTGMPNIMDKGKKEFYLKGLFAEIVLYGKVVCTKSCIIQRDTALRFCVE